LRPDTGQLFESLVFNYLEKDHDILVKNHYYRTQTKTEIDFITEKEGAVLLTEVKSGNYMSRPKALFEFEKKYGSVFSSIRKRVVNQSHYSFSGEIDYIPANLLLFLFTLQSVPSIMIKTFCIKHFVLFLFQSIFAKNHR